MSKTETKRDKDGAGEKDKKVCWVGQVLMVEVQRRKNPKRMNGGDVTRRV
jgi:hypothetical protein